MKAPAFPLIAALAAATLAVLPGLRVDAAEPPGDAPAATPSGNLPDSEMVRQGQALDKRLTERLEKADPELARLFAQANGARDRQDHATASELYGRVYDAAPSFVHALRRQCHEELAMGHREMAVALCRNAVRQDESADNLAALARALMTGTPNFPSPAQDQAEAMTLAQRAVAADPTNIFALTVECETAIERSERAVFEECVRTLESHYPEDAVTYFFRMARDAGANRFDQAIDDLERAHASGMIPDDVYREQLSRLKKASRSPLLVLPLLLRSAIVWLAIMAALLVAGLVLSRLTLRAARRPPAGEEGTVRGAHASLRRVYRAVLWLCCGYYYLSMPIVALLVLGLGGGAIYAFFAIGQIPIKLVVVVLVFTVYTLSAMVRSLFVRSVDQDPGEKLDLERHARLRTLLDEVAGRVGTRSVDNVYMTPGAQVAVMERGRSLLARARGRAERCLILGAAALEGFRLGPFKAVLAHEYGHFSNRDTAGGGFALAVRRSLLTMGNGIARGGAARWYNPAWLFVTGFYKIFLRISQGASRLQEVMADRWAALTYGSRAFEEGLAHVVARAVRFESHATAALNEVIKDKRPLENLYTYAPAKPPIAGGVETSVQEALARKPSPYDSHPSPQERIEWARALNAAGTGSTMGDTAEVWTLFPDRETIERAMTAVVRRNVALTHGVQIAGGAGPSKA